MDDLVEQSEKWIEKAAQPHSGTAMFIGRLADRIEQLEIKYENSQLSLIQANEVIEQLEARVDELKNRQPINIVMDRPPGPDSQFVEVELDNGVGISIGEWIEYGEYWALRITELPPPEQQQATLKKDDGSF